MAGGFPVVERTTRLPYPADVVYAWHTRPGAFERLTPPWERVEVVERTGGIEDGARAVLRVRAGPVPVRWAARHEGVVPGRQFVDSQTEGPFSHWLHSHRIVPDGESASFLTDRIEYAAPYGIAGAAADLWWVRPRLERMLAYRHAVLRDDLASHARAALAPLRVAISGASGLIGRSLSAFLSAGGHRVTRLVRRAPGPGEIGWDPAAGRLDGALLEGVDAVVHLSGANVGEGRWTAARRRRIRESRTRGTALLARALAGLARPPAVLVSVSGVGIYGNRGDETLPDGSAPGAADLDTPAGFLVEVCEAWEAATEPARAAGIRVAIPRLGVVLSPAGGALARLLPVFRLGLGGPIGSGRQWLSWLSIDDAVGIIHHAIATPGLAGAFNAGAPVPVTNADFVRTLGRVLHRPALLPVPARALRLAIGKMADATLLASARALPTRLEASGYHFRHAELEAALRFLLGRQAA
ncbi:MAG TPA: TIGR01777 family oxidoreductase [Gemmatimonadales bacterium]|nr:TIGR01777 family oxidoreductase [Gemmatimonadales bacterium]